MNLEKAHWKMTLNKEYAVLAILEDSEGLIPSTANVFLFSLKFSKTTTFHLSSMTYSPSLDSQKQHVESKMPVCTENE